MFKLLLCHFLFSIYTTQNLIRSNQKYHKFISKAIFPTAAPCDSCKMSAPVIGCRFRCSYFNLYFRMTGFVSSLSKSGSIIPWL